MGMSWDYDGNEYRRDIYPLIPSWDYRNISVTITHSHIIPTGTILGLGNFPAQEKHNDLDQKAHS